MNRIDPPQIFDDAAALDELAQNVRLACYPKLKTEVPAIKAAYAQYLAAQGNALDIANLPLPEAISSQLKALYKRPSKQLPHIKTFRENSGANCCPMCGSFHAGTLDHFMPKGQYPVFAVFGPNLVPACLCNSKRTSQVTGQNPNERILHPYFDDVLGDRLFVAQFEDLGLTPKITLRLALRPTHDLAPAVLFHMENVVERTFILDHIRKDWNRLLQRPSLAAAELQNTPASRNALKQALTSECFRQDEIHGSRNNWRSVFLAGLIDDHVLDWLFAAFQQPERLGDEPLLAGAV